MPTENELVDLKFKITREQRSHINLNRFPYSSNQRPEPPRVRQYADSSETRIQIMTP